MTMRQIAAIVATTVLGLVVGLTSPAYADKHQATDASGDVIALVPAVDDAVPQPDNTDFDIVRTLVNHKRGSVVIKVKLRDLTPLDTETVLQLVADVKSDKQRQAMFGLKSGPAKELLIVRGELSVKCPGARMKVSAADNYIKLVVPRSCLRRPRWIKVSVGMFSVDEAQNAYLDDGLRSGSALESPTKFTPKLKRG